MSEVIEKNVFLSSSMRETGLERNRISCFFEDLEGLKDRLSSVRFHFHHCQNMSNGIKTDKQDDYNRMAYESDFFIVVIKENFYNYTFEELKSAIRGYLDNGKPQILICYQKESQTRKNIHDYIEQLYSQIATVKIRYLPSYVYQHEDEIVYQILLLFNEQMKDAFKIEIVENHQVRINGEVTLEKEIFSLDNIPFYQRNLRLRDLRKKVEDKSSEIEEYRKTHTADRSEEYQRLQAELQQLEKEVQNERTRFLDYSLNLQRQDLFPYAAQLEELYLAEDKQRAYEILDRINEERRREIEDTTLMQSAVRDKAQATVDEIFKSIRICKEHFADAVLEQKTMDLYDRADEWILKFGLDRTVMIDKVEALKENNDNIKAMVYADELILYLTQDEKTPPQKLAHLYDLKGNLCYRLEGEWLFSAELYYRKAIDMIKDMDTEAEIMLLSFIYSNLAVLYRKLFLKSERGSDESRKYLTQAMDQQQEALKLKTRLLEKSRTNTDYRSTYALSLNCVGDICYYESEQPSQDKKSFLLESIKYYQEAYDIRHKFWDETEKQGEKADFSARIVRSAISIARSYLTLYIFERETDHLRTAEKYSAEALEIIRKLYDSNGQQHASRFAEVKYRRADILTEYLKAGISIAGGSFEDIKSLYESAIGVYQEMKQPQLQDKLEKAEAEKGLKDLEEYQKNVFRDRICL